MSSRWSTVVTCVSAGSPPSSGYRCRLSRLTGTRPLRTRRFFWKARWPPSASALTSLFSAASRRLRLTTNGTRCCRLGSLGKRRTRRICRLPAFAGISRTHCGPPCAQFATCPRIYVRPVLYSVEMRTTGCTGSRSSSSKKVRASSSGQVGPITMSFLAVRRIGRGRMPWGAGACAAFSSSLTSS